SGDPRRGRRDARLPRWRHVVLRPHGGPRAVPRNRVAVAARRPPIRRPASAGPPGGETPYAATRAARRRRRDFARGRPDRAGPSAGWLPGRYRRCFPAPTDPRTRGVVGRMTRET